MKTLKKEKQGFLVEFNYMGARTEEGEASENSSAIPDFLSPLIQNYQDVFYLPQGLPPT